MAVANEDADSEILYRARHDRGRDESISDAVARALAAVENVEPEDLELRLYDSVDADALDCLCETTAERPERLRVAFTIGEYEVLVEDGGRLLVRERGDWATRHRRQ